MSAATAATNLFVDHFSHEFILFSCSFQVSKLWQYWDWPKYMKAPQDSPIFNGDPYSLGGNGQYIPHNGTVITPPEGVSGGDILLPAGLGGGYVVTGPFANMTINLGPFGGTFGTEPGPDGGLGYNPRGLKRDVGPGINERYCNYTTVLGKCKSVFIVC